MLQRFKYIVIFLFTVYTYGQIEPDNVEIYVAPNSYMTRAQIENLMKRTRRDRYHVIEESSCDSLMVPGAWWRDTANHQYKYMDWAYRSTDSGFIMYQKVWVLNRDIENYEIHIHQNVEHYSNSITPLAPYWTQIVSRNVTSYKPVRTALIGNFLNNARINAIITDGYTDYTIDKNLELVKHTVISTDSIDYNKVYIEHYIGYTNRTIYGTTLPYIYLMYKAVVKDNEKTYYENLYKVRLDNFPGALWTVYLRDDVTMLQYLKTNLDLKLGIEDNALYNWKENVIYDTVSYAISGVYYSTNPLTSNYLYILPTKSGTVPYYNALWRKAGQNPYYYTPPKYSENGRVYGALPDMNPNFDPNSDEAVPVWNSNVYMAGGRFAFSLMPIYKYPLYRNLDTVGIYDSLFYGGGISDSSVVADVIKINDTTLEVKRKAHIYNKGHYVRRTRLDSFLVDLARNYYTYNNYYFDTTINNTYIDTNYYINNYYIDTNYYYNIYNVDTNYYITQIDTNIYITNNYYTANPDTFVTGIYAYFENDSLKIELTRSQGAPMLFTSTKIEQMKKHGINDTTWHTGYPLNIWNGGTNFNAYDPYTHFQMLMKYDQETQQIKPTDILARDTWVKNGQSINYYTKNGYWRMYGATAGDLLRFDYYNDYGIFFTPDNMIGCNGLHIFDWSKNYCGGIYADTGALSIDVNRYKYIFNYGKISNVRPAEANGEVVVFEQLPNVSGLDTSVRIVESIKVGSDTSIYYTSSIYTFRTGLLKKITPLLPDTIIRAPGNEISTPPKRLAWSNIIPNKKEYYMGYVYLMGDCEECNKTLISKTPTTSIKIRLDNIGQESGHYRVYIDSVIEGKTVIKGFDKSGVLFDGTEQEFNVELKDPEIIDINGQSKDLTNGGPLAYYLKGYVIDSTTQNGIQITDFKVYISTKKSNTTTPPIIPPTTGGWGGTDDDYYYSMPYSFWLGFASKKYTGEGLSGGDLDPEYFDENCEGWIVKWKAHTVFPSSSSSPGYGSDCNADNLWVTVDDEEAPMNDFTDPVDLCFIKAIKPAIKFGSSCMRLEVWFIHNEIPYSAFNVIYYPNQSNYKISNQTPDNGIPTEPEQIDTVKMIKHLINDTTWHFGFPLTVEHGGTNNTNFSNTIDNQTYNFIAYDPTNNRFIRTPYNYSNIVQASSDTVIAIVDTNVIATKYYVDSKSNTADSSIYATRYWSDGLFLKKVDTTNKWQPKGDYASSNHSHTNYIQKGYAYADLMENNYIGNQSGQVAAGNHNHNGEYITPTDTTNKWQPKGNYASSDHQHTLTQIVGQGYNHNDIIKWDAYTSMWEVGSMPAGGGDLSKSDSNVYFYRPWKIENSFEPKINILPISKGGTGNIGFNDGKLIEYGWSEARGAYVLKSSQYSTGDFALSNHTHSGYATTDWVSGNFSPLSHNHDLQYLKELDPSARGTLSIHDVGINVALNLAIEHLGEGQGLAKLYGNFTKALLNSDTIATQSYARSLVSGFAPINHTHSADNITTGILPISIGGTGNIGFVNDQLIEYAYSEARGGYVLKSSGYSKNSFALANHTHSGYATTDWVSNNFSTLGHNHDGSYLSLAGGSLSGGLNVSGNVFATAFYSSGNLVATQSWVSGSYSPLGHTHSGYATESWVSNNFSSNSHTHTTFNNLTVNNLTANGYITAVDYVQSIGGYRTYTNIGSSGTISKTFVTGVSLNKTKDYIEYKDWGGNNLQMQVVTDVSLNVSTATITLQFDGGLYISSSGWSGVYKEGEIHLTMDEFEKLKNNTWQIDPEYLEFLQWKQWKKEQENKIKVVNK